MEMLSLKAVTSQSHDSQNQISAKCENSFICLQPHGNTVCCSLIGRFVLQCSLGVVVLLKLVQDTDCDLYLFLWLHPLTCYMSMMSLWCHHRDATSWETHTDTHLHRVPRGWKVIGWLAGALSQSGVRMQSWDFLHCCRAENLLPDLHSSSTHTHTHTVLLSLWGLKPQPQSPEPGSNLNPETRSGFRDP